MDNTTIMSWNVRGLNDRARRDVVHKLLDNIRPSIVCLQETKLDVISQYLMFAMLGMSFADFAYLLASNRGGVLVTAREAKISLSDTPMYMLVATQSRSEYTHAPRRTGTRPLGGSPLSTGLRMTTTRSSSSRNSKRSGMPARDRGPSARTST